MWENEWSDSNEIKQTLCEWEYEWLGWMSR